MYETFLFLLLGFLLVWLGTKLISIKTNCSAKMPSPKKTIRDKESKQERPVEKAPTLVGSAKKKAKPASKAPKGSKAPKAPSLEVIPTHSVNDKVEFSVFSPKSITPASNYFDLGVWAYLSHQYAEIIESEKEIGRDSILARKVGVSVQLGRPLTIKIEINGFVVENPIDFIVWNGSASNAIFIVKIPQGVGVGRYPGKVLVGCEGITIAKIGFLISMGAIQISDIKQKHRFSDRFSWI